MDQVECCLKLSNVSASQCVDHQWLDLAQQHHARFIVHDEIKRTVIKRRVPSKRLRSRACYEKAPLCPDKDLEHLVIGAHGQRL